MYLINPIQELLKKIIEMYKKREKIQRTDKEKCLDFFSNSSRILPLLPSPSLLFLSPYPFFFSHSLIIFKYFFQYFCINNYNNTNMKTFTLHIEKYCSFSLHFFSIHQYLFVHYLISQILICLYFLYAYILNIYMDVYNI